MRARARLEVERGGVVRTLRSAPPLTLIPVRGRPVVHLVNSAASPLGGDDLTLTVRVGAHACLTLSGVAAAVALPGPRGLPSRMAVHLELSEGARVEYLPEPTVITRRARHESVLVVSLAGDAHLHTRETVVLGRDGELPGELTTTTHVTRDGHPVLRQTLVVTREVLLGNRVLATELSTSDDRDTASGTWWSRTRLAAGGTLTTSLADDAVTASRQLAAAALLGTRQQVPRHQRRGVRVGAEVGEVQDAPAHEPVRGVAVVHADPGAGEHRVDPARVAAGHEPAHPARPGRGEHADDHL
ncbi:urease accessory protein UreD [Actinophytocola algeriensis]|uniref:Urease accessory protein UreD n=1 Tax=Actinophytocola algeriensis TaxID=1768010 RepID=A0A7W7QFA0_9PSEU|nr:urease accessory protein UreD [Actinophytocola algeriensis]MBB4912561.1 urease accessory protein [Actinophytocola algeriensis]MBE1478935.1 urease accessory protein [Actinophytocola algeriensis]